MSLELTDIRVYPIKAPKGKTVAFASITFNEILVISDITIIDGKNGLFATFPRKPDANKENGYRDVVFSLDSDFREQVMSAVINQYNNL